MSSLGEGGRLRILQFLPSVQSDSGGPVRSTLANCRAVHAADPEIETVLVSTRYGLDASWGRELRDQLLRGMSLKLFPQVGRHTTNFSPALVRWLWRHGGEFDLLVLRALLHPLTTAAGWVARRRRLPYVVVPHGTLSEWTFRHRRPALKRLYLRLVELRTLDGAAAVRFTSEVERREASGFGYSARAVVIPHPYVPHFDGPASPARDPERVLFLSRLDPKKGVERLLAAVARARERRPDLRLVLAGSGEAPYEKKIHQIIRDLGLEEAVELPGFVTGDEKERLLRRASVFVLSSENENFGVAVVEALDAGLPIVISPKVGVAAAVQEYGAGRVVERSAEAVADAVIEILEDPDRAREMGRQGRRIVRERFAPEVVGPAVAALYRDVARRRI